MKKYILIFFLILSTGCSIKFTHNNETNNNNNLHNDEVINEYVDDNPITIGIYQNGTLDLLSKHSSKWIAMKDIGVFTSAFTNDTHLNEYYYQDVWAKYYKNYSNIDDYKIGYYIGFYLSDGSYLGESVLSPNEMKDFCPYIYIYLYDDVNQIKGSWYIHLEKDEVTDDTLLTSIKIMAGEEIKQVVSPITLTAFTYNDDDDFVNGKYRGNSSYTIEIKNE